jgi:hypothetical protein
MKAFKKQKQKQKKLKEKKVLDVLNKKNFDKKEFYFKMLEKDKIEFIKKIQSEIMNGEVKSLF